MPTAIEMTITCSTLKPTVETAAPVEASTDADTVRPRKFLRDDALQEVPPRADRVGVGGRQLVVRDAVAGLDRDAEDDADRHRDERRDAEPEQGLPGQAKRWQVHLGVEALDAGAEAGQALGPASSRARGA